MPKRRILVDDDVHEQLMAAVRASRQSVTGLAKALHCNRSTLYKWLNGANAIPPAALEQLCSLIHMSEEQRRMQFERRGYALPGQPDHPHEPSPALHQLRAPVSDFVGRAREVKQIVTTLAAVAGRPATAICGLHGMGGVGKTELAYMVAQRLVAHFPDAQIVLALRGAGSDAMTPAEALQHVLRSFDPLAQLSQDIHELQARYRSYLHGKRALVLADDAADAAQVRALLPPPGSALIITSRQRFTLEGMRSFDLDMLPEGAAVALLHSICLRIGAAAPRLAALCGYLPLALRISAGLLASDDSYPIEEYLDQLETARLPHLRAAEDTDDPQASIEFSLALSYAALTPAAQEALACLGVFPASFDFAAARAVMPSGGDTAALLGQLRRHNLVQWNAQQARYQLHDLVCAFALSRLTNEVATRQRHAVYFLQLAEQNSTAERNRHAQWLATMEREHANLRVACQWLERSQAYDELLRLAVALGPFWIARDHLAEGQTVLRVALAHAPLGSQRLQAHALMYAGALARVSGDAHAAHERYQASRSLWELLEDEEQHAEATFQLGLVVADQGEKILARSLFEEALALFQRIGRHERVGILLSNLGRMALDAGDYATARQHFDASYALLHDSDDVEEFAWLLTNMARYAGTQNDFTAALGHVDKALAHFEQLSHSQGIAWALLRRGMALKELQRYAEAQTTLTVSLALFERLLNITGQAMTHQVLAEVALAQGDEAAVLEHAGAGFRIRRKQNNRPGMSMCLILLSWLFIPERVTSAAMLLGAAEELLAGTGVSLDTAEFHRYVDIATSIRAQMSAAGCGTIYQQGRALSLDEVFALVLNVEGSAAATE